MRVCVSVCVLEEKVRKEEKDDARERQRNIYAENYGLAFFIVFFFLPFFFFFFFGESFLT